MIYTVVKTQSPQKEKGTLDWNLKAFAMLKMVGVSFLQLTSIVEWQQMNANVKSHGQHRNLLGKTLEHCQS